MTTGFSMQKLIGLILVVVVIVIVLFFFFMFSPFVDKIKGWHLFGDEGELKLGESGADQFLNAYEYCKGVEGDGCLCNTGIIMSLKEDEVITIKEKSTLGGIRIESSEGFSKNAENARHCFGLPEDNIADEVKIYLKEDKLMWERGSALDNPLYNEPFKLYKKVIENKIFLCIPSFITGLEDCSETKSCKAPNQLCKEGETCLNKKSNYNGEGICCKESCVNIEKQNEANNLFEGGTNLFNAGNYDDAKSAFLNIINNADYEETTIYDDAIFYYTKSLEGLGLDEEALRAYESLIFRRWDLRGTSFNDLYLKADEESKKYFGCGGWESTSTLGVVGRTGKDECTGFRDSILNRCYPVVSSSWYPFFGDVECLPCDSYAVCERLKGENMCETSPCLFVGYGKCSYSPTKGCTKTDDRKTCSDIKYSELCETSVCVNDNGLSYCCEWNGEECVEKS